MRILVLAVLIAKDGKFLRLLLLRNVSSERIYIFPNYRHVDAGCNLLKTKMYHVPR